MNFQILQGDAIEVLRALPAESVHCCVTSPPYWGLRDYGIPPRVWGGQPNCSHIWGAQVIQHATNHVDKRRWNHARNGRGEEQPKAKRPGWKRQDIAQGNFCIECGAWSGVLGLEPTPELFVAHTTEIFAEVRRVLRDDGTLWLNLGDSYATGGGKVGDCPGGGEQGARWKGFRGDHPHDAKRNGAAIPLGPGTQPNRMPIAGLKPKDLVGLPWRVAFALQADGWYLRSEIIWAKPNPTPESVTDRPTKSHEQIFLLAKSQQYFYDADAIREPFGTDPSENYPARAYITGRGDQDAALIRGNDRGKSGGFPPKSHKGSTFHNGKTAAHQLGRASEEPREDNPLGRNKRSVWTVPTAPYPECHFATFPPDLIVPCIKAGCPAGGTVLDPFAGSGTTLEVARRLGCESIGIELSPEYCKLIEKRMQQQAFEFNLKVLTSAQSGTE